MLKKPLSVGVKSALIAGCAIIIAAVVGLLHKESSADNHAQQITATAFGNGSSAQAAGHDINNGVSDSTLQQVLNLKDVELSERMLTDYPHGCVILGLENGKVIYDSRLKEIKVTADWDNTKYAFDEKTHMMAIYFSKFIMDYTNGSHLEFNGSTFEFPYLENKPFRNRIIGGLGDFYFQVLDTQKGILLIGFK
jgi:hypothetical protein